jgi:hypothetical protein
MLPVVPDLRKVRIKNLKKDRFCSRESDAQNLYNIVTVSIKSVYFHRIDLVRLRIGKLTLRLNSVVCVL